MNFGYWLIVLTLGFAGTQQVSTETQSRGLPILNAVSHLAPNFAKPSHFLPISEEQDVSLLSAAVILKPGTDNTAAIARFKELGFDTQSVGDNVLLIMADKSVFERSFATKIKVDQQGARMAQSDASDRHLPTAALHAPLNTMVQEVEFDSPPDFGPSNY